MLSWCWNDTVDLWATVFELWTDHNHVILTDALRIIYFPLSKQQITTNISGLLETWTQITNT